MYCEFPKFKSGIQVNVVRLMNVQNRFMVVTNMPTVLIQEIHTFVNVFLVIFCRNTILSDLPQLISLINLACFVGERVVS